MKKLVLLSVLLSVFFFSFSPNVNSKKAFFVILTDTFFPQYSSFVSVFPADHLNRMVDGSSEKEWLMDYGTVIHESYHHYNSDLNQKAGKDRKYFINDQLVFNIPHFKSFPSRELGKKVPEELKKKIFRYKTYIESNDVHDMDTQVNGIFGLFEEFCAYYQDYNSYVELYPYLKDKFPAENTQIWVDYLVKNASIRNSLNEFQLFISWYMQAARDENPQVYFEILRSDQLKQLFSFVEAENYRLERTFDKNRTEIISFLGSSINLRGELIGNADGDIYYSMYDSEIEFTKSLLREDDHSILENLRTYY